MRWRSTGLPRWPAPAGRVEPWRRKTTGKKDESPQVDFDLIHQLARVLDETGLTEIEFERDGQRVRVARHAQRHGERGGAAYRARD